MELNNIPTAVLKGSSKLHRLHRDNPDSYNFLLYAIENGAFPHIAASAIGITPALFRSWLHKGSASTHSSVYRKLYLDVTQALGKARLVAEVSVAQTDPRYYLTHGPGRPTSTDPGWSPSPIPTEHLPSPLPHSSDSHTSSTDPSKSSPTDNDILAVLADLHQIPTHAPVSSDQSSQAQTVHQPQLPDPEEDDNEPFLNPTPQPSPYPVQQQLPDNTPSVSNPLDNQ